MRIRSRLIVYLFLLLCGLVMVRFSYALDAPWKSSTTATADSTVTLCGQFVIPIGTNTVAVPAQAWIHGIIIDSPTIGSTIQLYDSSFTVISATSSLTIGPITLQTMVSPIIIDAVFRNGLNYVKAGTSIITILYSCF